MGSQARVFSPVPEEGESSVSLPSQKTPTPPAISEELTDRPYSPLPPLIIEIEPKINKHDEPEEYYEKLEKKIKIIYRRICIENRSPSDISEDTDTSVLEKTYTVRRASFDATNEINNDSLTDDANGLFEDNIVDVSETDTEKMNQSLKDSLPKDDPKTTDSGWSNFTLTKNDLFLGKYLTEDSLSSTNETLPRSTSDDSETDEEMVSSFTESHKHPDGCNENRAAIQNETIMSQGDVENEEEDSTSEHSQILSKYSQKLPVAVSTTVTSKSSVEISYRQITFKADVHVDATVIITKNIPSVVCQQNVRRDISDKSLDKNHKNSAELEKHELSDKNTDISSKGNEVNSTKTDKSELEKHDISDNSTDSTSSEINEGNSTELEKQSISDKKSDTSPEDDEYGNIEVMRTPRIHTSVASLQSNPYDHSYCNDTEMKIASRSLEARSESESSKESDQTEAEDEESIDYDILNTSVVIDGRQNENAVKRKSPSPLLPSPAKRPKYKDAEAQANYRDIIVEWNRNILRDIFRGTPYVYGVVNNITTLTH